MLSASMALNGLVVMGASQDWATHDIEHELSAFYDIPHGAGLAIITPRWMEVVKEEKKNKLVHYGKRIWGLKGAESKIAKGAIEKTYSFFKSLGIKMSLKDWDIDSEHFKIMTSRLVKRGVGEKPLKKKEIKEILRSCL